MDKKIDWNKYHRFQDIEGWCGPAVVQMILAVAGIEKTQKEIAKYIYKEWWGTPHQLMLAYLSQFFKTVNYKNSAIQKDIKFHLNRGHVVVVNWWDNLESENEGDGHYSIVAGYEKRVITLVDPTNLRIGVWQLPFGEFRKRWYDFLDTHKNTYIDGWMLWVDPKTKIVLEKVF